MMHWSFQEVLMSIASLWSHVLILVWIGEGVPTSSSQMMSHRIIEAILFFQRFPKMRPSFVRQPRRLMFEARIRMWGQIIPKRGDTMFPVRISHDSLDLLASVDGLHPFILVPCPYVGLDLRGCSNILFTAYEPPDDRGNIIVLFIFILTCSLACFY